MPQAQPLDALTLRHLVPEWQALLVGSKLSRIQQHHYHDLLLTFYHPYTGQQQFYVEIGADCGFAAVIEKSRLPDTLEAPRTPANFCVLLRKYLASAKLKQITQVPDERVITLSFDGINEIAERTTYQLVIELMGRHSNMILLEDNLILAVAHGVSDNQSRIRQLRISDQYESVPPQQGKTPFSQFTASTLNSATPELGKLISGIGQVNLTHWISNYSNSVEELIKAHQVLLTKPHYLLMQNQQSEAQGYYLSASGPLQNDKEYGSINALVADYYIEQLVEKYLGQKKGQLKKLLLNQVEKLEEKITALGQVIQDDPEVLKQAADNALLVHAQNQYQQNTFELEDSETGIESPQAMYAKYKRNKARIGQAKADFEQFSQRLSYAKELIEVVQQSREMTALKAIEADCESLGWAKQKQVTKQKTPAKSKSSSKAQQKMSITRYELDEGYQLWVGKSGLQNEYILRHVARPEDWWLHVQGTQGGHVLLRGPNKTNTAKEDMPAIKAGASIAVFYSKLKNEKNVPVIYTRAKYVRMVPSAALPGYMQYDYETQLFVDNTLNVPSLIEPKAEGVGF